MGLITTAILRGRWGARGTSGTARDGEDVDLYDDGAWVCLDGGWCARRIKRLSSRFATVSTMTVTRRPWMVRRPGYLNELCDGEDADFQGGVQR